MPTLFREPLLMSDKKLFELFTVNGKIYRFCGNRRPMWEHGYIEPSIEHYNEVQRKRWWGWQTVAREHVPSHVWISLATLGTTNWESTMIARWRKLIDKEKA